MSHPHLGNVLPAQAGIRLKSNTIGLLAGPPCSSRDSPTMIEQPIIVAMSTPHTRSIGNTIRHVFILPRPANAGNTKSRVRKVNKQTSKLGSGATKREGTNRASKPKLTDDQKRELGRVRHAEERQRRKELGLCRDCTNVAIEGQIRCHDCAEKHRQSRKHRSRQQAPETAISHPDQSRHRYNPVH